MPADSAFHTPSPDLAISDDGNHDQVPGSPTATAPALVFIAAVVAAFAVAFVGAGVVVSLGTDNASTDLPGRAPSQLGAANEPYSTTDNTAGDTAHLALSDDAVWVEADEAAISLFVDDWTHSLTSTYTMTGSLRREPLTEDQSMFGLRTTESSVAAELAEPIVLAVRQTQFGNYSLLQVGDVATVVDPANGKRNCRRIDGAFWCSPTSEADPGSVSLSSSDDDLAVRLAGLRQAVEDQTATHRLYRLEDGEPAEIALRSGVDDVLITERLRCWEVRALGGDDGHPWGRRTLFCFDRETQGVVLQQSFGQYRIETFMAETVSADVTVADLEPR